MTPYQQAEKVMTYQAIGINPELMDIIQIKPNGILIAKCKHNNGNHALRLAIPSPDGGYEIWAKRPKQKRSFAWIAEHKGKAKSAEQASQALARWLHQHKKRCKNMAS